jgi:hypothetical protein
MLKMHRVGIKMEFTVVLHYMHTHLSCYSLLDYLSIFPVHMYCIVTGQLPQEVQVPQYNCTTLHATGYVLSEADRYVKTFYINENIFVFAGPFYHRCIQKQVHKNLLGIVRMRLISHRQPKHSEVFVEMQNPAPILQNI